MNERWIKDKLKVNERWMKDAWKTNETWTKGDCKTKEIWRKKGRHINGTWSKYEWKMIKHGYSMNKMWERINEQNMKAEWTRNKIEMTDEKFKGNE